MTWHPNLCSVRACIPRHTYVLIWFLSCSWSMLWRSRKKSTSASDSTWIRSSWLYWTTIPPSWKSSTRPVLKKSRLAFCATLWLGGCDSPTFLYQDITLMLWKKVIHLEYNVNWIFHYTFNDVYTHTPLGFKCFDCVSYLTGLHIMLY